jgi:hypothetical protein
MVCHARAKFHKQEQPKRIFFPAQSTPALHGGMQLVSFTMGSYPMGFIVPLGSVSVLCFWIACVAAIGLRFVLQYRSLEGNVKETQHSASVPDPISRYSCFSVHRVTQEKGSLLMAEENGGLGKTDRMTLLSSCIFKYSRLSIIRGNGGENWRG